jgi:hypothetical protein
MRWERAFSNEHEECGADRIDRKATIVIEHVIQASDVGTLPLLPPYHCTYLIPSTLLLLLFFVSFFQHIPCSTGVSTLNGISFCSEKCTRLICRGDWRSTLAKFGT